MKAFFYRLLLPAAYDLDSPTRQSQVKTSNGLILIFIFASFIGISINLLIGNYARIAFYLLFYPVAFLVLYLNKIKKDVWARSFLAFFPGIFLFTVPMLNGMNVDGDRQGFFLAVFMNAMLPLILFSDSGEKARFLLGCLFYFILIAIMDKVLHFSQLQIEQIGVGLKIKELLFYLIIAACFGLKLSLKSDIETHLNSRNKDLSIQRDEIEVLLEEVRSKKEELFIQQEALSIQNDQLLSQRNELLAVKNRLEKNNEALVHMTSEQSLTNGDYNLALKYISEIAAKTLDISRASIWELNESKDVISCRNLYSNSVHTCGMELNAKDFPKYFEAIKAKVTIVADDAQNNEFTSEFKDNYLIPLQITSMLDSPFFIEGKMKGILCFEHQNTAKKWSQEDIFFSRAIADLIPLSYESAQRKMAQNQVQQQNELLISKQQEILELNEQLEVKVAKRTAQLESRNQQLEEYAFYNAHVLRAPICSLQGLIALPNIDPDFVIDEKFLAHLKKALLEMETVTKEVSNKLRKDITVNM